MKLFGLKQSVMLCAMTMVGLAQAQAQQMPLVDRAAQGDPVQYGQARRITADQSDMLRNSIRKGEVKNVILLIGDGMGDSEITAARNYAYGAAGFLPGIDALPITGQYTHYSLDRVTHKPNYVPDSAAAGTAIATGSKTYNGGLGVDVFGQPHASLLELAKAAGKATGNVSTAEIQDATPAAQIAHVEARKCYGPQATSVKCPKQASENGGAGSISEQLLKVRPDVTLGGGMKSFEEVAKGGEFKGEKLIEAAKKRGYQVVTTAQELDV